MNTIYKFKLEQEVEVEESVTKKDTEGKEFKVLEKVKKNVPKNFVLKRPTRGLYDEAEVFYAIQTSDLIRQGVLSAVQLNKRYLNDGGILSEEQKKQYGNLYAEVAIKKNQYDEIAKIPEKERKEQDKVNSERLLNELVELMNKIRNVEDAKDTVLSNTAEILARDRTIRWWMLFLSYEELGDNNYKPVFPGDSYEAKNDIYDEMDERQNDFEYQVVERLYLATGLWYVGKAQTQQDFDVLIEVDKRQDIIENKELIETLNKAEPAVQTEK